MINFDSVLHTLQGAPFLSEDKSSLTLGQLAGMCLLRDFDQSTPSDQKYASYQLARQVMKGGEFELLPPLVKKIKDSIGRQCEPHLLGAAFDALGD